LLNDVCRKADIILGNLRQPINLRSRLETMGHAENQ
jgi:hypothetical protein